MIYDSSNMNTNWISNIIREDKEPRVLRKKYISPQTIKSGNLYKESIVSWIDSLEQAMSKKLVDLRYISTIKDLRNDIVYILDMYHSGKVDESYRRMKNVIGSLINDSAELAISTVQNSIALNDIENMLDKTVGETRIEFFRARISDKYCVFTREEMLHIPFDLREKVESTRFSIPGLPCLYLATTSYCCWLELRTPPDHQFNVSPVRINQKNRILNLTMNADTFEQIVEYTEKNKEANKYTIEALKLWILTYASSFKVDVEDRAFKEEYIIPQLIMLVSRDLGLDGVSYYSKRVEDDRFAHMRAVNLALFAKYNGEKNTQKYAKILKLLHLLTMRCLSSLAIVKNVEVTE